MTKNRLNACFMSIPNTFDRWVRSVDEWFASTTRIKKFHGRSLFAFLLPLPIYFFIAYGPSLASNSAGTVWRGWVAALFVGIAIIVQLWYFLQDEYHGMAWLHFSLIIVFAGATYLLAGDATEASGGIYRHYFLILAPIAIFTAVPCASMLLKLPYFRIPEEVACKFRSYFNAAEMVKQGNPRSVKAWDLFGAAIVSILRTPLQILTPGAIAVVFVSAEHMVLWGMIASIISLMLFILSNYDPKQDSFVRITRRLFFTGGTLLVSLAVIILALLRISGVDYVTTMLNASSKWIILSYISSSFVILWLYDFWIDQAKLALLGNRYWDFNQPSGEITRHGGGRIAVTPKDTGGEARMFEPITFLTRIAEIAPQQYQADLQEETTRVEQRLRAFSYLCFILFAMFLGGIGWRQHKLDQEPGLRASAVITQNNEKFFNIHEKLTSSDGEPVVMVAASGGGTRAALYTAAVLHGLSRLDKLERVVLVSGVSGGSAALAYFAINRPSLLQNKDDSWKEMLDTLSEPFIDDVLTGAAEWRIASGNRLGQLLTESFNHRFTKGDEAGTRTSLGEITDVGLIFNTSLCGYTAPDGSLRNKESAMDAGGRLVITNLRSQFDMNKDKESDQNGWTLDLPFEVVQDPSISLFAGASLSANFPPVFSNASIALGNKRYWVTDGGAVENRGLISILLALIDELEAIQEEMKKSGKNHDLAEIRILVADASAFQPDYTSDRGLGAKLGASVQIANRLIKELTARASSLHSSISGKKNGLRVVNLPMPNAMRASGTFGTHWKMPPTLILKDPFSGDEQGVKVKSDVAKEIIDAMFSEKYSTSYIQERWPELDAKRIMEETQRPWDALLAGFK